MRGAGCIINDLADRNIDRQVERTKNRPLASGELQFSQAVYLLVILLLASFTVAVQLGLEVVMWGALALLPIIIYPFMKRISWWPQLFLGMVFNWGAFIGWASVRDQVEFPAILLYIGGVFLTLGYDTIYAHQDKYDDARIGVRSTALRLRHNTKIFVAIVYALAIICFAEASIIATGNFSGIAALIPASFHCAWQVYSLDINNPQSAKKIFLSNAWLGFLVFLGLLINKL